MAASGPRAGLSGLRAGARRFRLTRRGTAFVVAAVLCFAAAAALSAPALLYATGLLLGLVLVGLAFVGWGHSKVVVDRSFSPQVVEPGQGIRARLTVANQSAAPCPEASWTDRLPRVVAGTASGVLPALGPVGADDARIAATYALSSGTRGHHEVGPLAIQVVDPFGLVRRARTFGGRHRLTVLPHRYPLDPIRPRGVGDDGSTRPAPQNVGLGEDDVIARRYVAGDAMKRLHWKATAHRGELMVRQEEQHLSPRASIVLDLDADSHGTALHRGQWEHSPTLEWSVSAVASVATHLAQAGFVVTLASHDGAVDVVIAEGQDSVRDAMIALAGVEASTGADVRPGAVERFVVLVTGRLDADRAQRWVRELAGDAGVHAIVSSATREPVLDDLAAAGWSVATYGPRSDVPEVWSALDGSVSRAQG